MVAFPNTVLIRAERDYLVDPGLIMQGAPVIGALQELGVDPNEVKDVILTHLHFDHAEGLAGYDAADLRPPDRDRGALRPDRLRPAGDGEPGDPRRRGRRDRARDPVDADPGHSDGLISLLVDTDDGLVVIASYFRSFARVLRADGAAGGLGPERDELLEQWKRIRSSHMVVPGHYPPVTPQ